MVQRSADKNNPVSRPSKRKAQDAWRHLKPRTYSKPSVIVSRSRKDTNKRPKKKRKLVSSKRWFHFLVLIVALLMIQDAEDMAEMVPRRHAQPIESDEDGEHDLPPRVARQKRALRHGSSDKSDQEDELSQRDNVSSDEDLQGLNNNDIAAAFDNEVSTDMFRQYHVW